MEKLTYTMSLHIQQYDESIWRYLLYLFRKFATIQWIYLKIFIGRFSIYLIDQEQQTTVTDLYATYRHQLKSKKLASLRYITSNPNLRHALVDPLAFFPLSLESNVQWLKSRVMEGSRQFMLRVIVTKVFDALFRRSKFVGQRCRGDT